MVLACAQMYARVPSVTFHNQVNTMKDFFLGEDTGYEVIKEEKH